MRNTSNDGELCVAQELENNQTWYVDGFTGVPEREMDDLRTDPLDKLLPRARSAPVPEPGQQEQQQTVESTVDPASTLAERISAHDSVVGSVKGSGCQDGHDHEAVEARERPLMPDNQAFALNNTASTSERAPSPGEQPQVPSYDGVIETSLGVPSADDQASVGDSAVEMEATSPTELMSAYKGLIKPSQRADDNALGMERAPNLNPDDQHWTPYSASSTSEGAPISEDQTPSRNNAVESEGTHSPGNQTSFRHSAPGEDEIPSSPGRESSSPKAAVEAGEREPTPLQHTAFHFEHPPLSEGASIPGPTSPRNSIAGEDERPLSPGHQISLHDAPVEAGEMEATPLQQSTSRVGPALLSEGPSSPEHHTSPRISTSGEDDERPPSPGLYIPLRNAPVVAGEMEAASLQQSALHEGPAPISERPLSPGHLISPHDAPAEASETEATPLPQSAFPLSSAAAIMRPPSPGVHTSPHNAPVEVTEGEASHLQQRAFPLAPAPEVNTPPSPGHQISPHNASVEVTEGEASHTEQRSFPWIPASEINTQPIPGHQITPHDASVVAETEGTATLLQQSDFHEDPAPINEGPPSSELQTSPHDAPVEVSEGEASHTRQRVFPLMPAPAVERLPSPGHQISPHDAAPVEAENEGVSTPPQQQTLQEDPAVITESTPSPGH
ncbi:hypothetical protein F5Y17DRAFT_380442 [Xylariaceae sp. FL0594]|nr:hypothetical protein F5Y17DRAFT_380442 [Xylariaceae sp. FL0594]